MGKFYHGRQFSHLIVVKSYSTPTPSWPPCKGHCMKLFMSSLPTFKLSDLWSPVFGFCGKGHKRCITWVKGETQEAAELRQGKLTGTLLVMEMALERGERETPESRCCLPRIDAYVDGRAIFHPRPHPEKQGLEPSWQSMERWSHTYLNVAR